MSSSSSPAASEEELTLTVKWSGKEYTVRVCGDDSIGELKRRICQLTNVLPKRQKLLYPKIMGSRLANDATLLSVLPLKSSLKMTMIGYFKFIKAPSVANSVDLLLGSDSGEGLNFNVLEENSAVTSIREWRESCF